ncbi:MAG: hypothetical protein ACMXYL_03265, partial [Candidatus Woesearchaeota archaeon]
LLLFFFFFGCSTGSLGPNQCHPTDLPRWCPLDSTGSTALRDRCGYREGGRDIDFCGCRIHFECVYTTGACRACTDPCRRCPPGASCTSPTTDWCTTDPVCTVFIGYTSPNTPSWTQSCEDRQGKYLYGVYRGDGTYDDCLLEGTVCASGRRLRYSPPFTVEGVPLGPIQDLCPDGHIVDGNVWRIGQWDVYTGYRCASDSECTGGGADPTPEPDPTECTPGDHDQCNHLDYIAYKCDGTYPSMRSNKEVWETECTVSGACQLIQNNIKSDSVWCDEGWRATACGNEPQACVTDSRRCAC